MATTRKPKATKAKATVSELTIVPNTVKGTHLTVTTNPDGTTELSWDWDVLLAEIREATKGMKQDLVIATEEKVKKTRASRKKTAQ